MEKMQSIDNQQINKRIMYEIYDRKEQLLLNQISKDAFNCTFSKLKNEHHENIVLEIYDEIPYLMEQPPF